MGTRCVTIFKNRQVKYVYDSGNGSFHEDGFESVELFRMYRHWDGYPSGNGMDLANAIIAADKGNGKNNRNWAACMLAALFTGYNDYEIEGHDDEHGDLDYLYVVEGDYANYGGKGAVDKLPVTISVWDFGWDIDSRYDSVLDGEPIFSGTAYEFAERFGN